MRADRFQRLAGGANNGSEVVAFVVCDSMFGRVEGYIVASLFLATPRWLPAVHSHLETKQTRSSQSQSARRRLLTDCAMV